MAQFRAFHAPYPCGETSRMPLAWPILADSLCDEIPAHGLRHNAIRNGAITADRLPI